MIKKLYQLIISRLDGENILSRHYRESIVDLVSKGIGGFIIFGGKRDDVRDFLDYINSKAEIPLFIASDVERGIGQQIEGCTTFPCQMSQAAALNTSEVVDSHVIEGMLQAIAAEAKDVGINMPLIPVLDVNRDPDNPIICTRAFSDNHDKVSWFGSHYVKILEGSGLLSCAKHFPGHGDTSMDSHLCLPVINKSLEDLMANDIVPFKEAIKAGVSSIMIGHLKIPALDDQPASLSRRIVTSLLRKDLGYDELVLTDALNMKALKGFKNVPSRCIEAGVDVLLHPEDPDLTVRELMSASDSGEIQVDRINEATNRILKTKDKLKRIKKSKPEARHENHISLSTRITEASITLVKAREYMIPIREKKVFVVFAGDRQFFESSPLLQFFRNVSSIDKFNGDGDDFPMFLEGNERIAEKIFIFSIFNTVAAWKGRADITEHERKLINRLIEKAKSSVVISFGCPYVLRYFANADLLIAAYEPSDQAQRAVIKCLQGLEDFRGRLPITLNL
ncbi:MAG: glycoside hydrolase family 3 N-terminal domain-containing protein [Nitrospirota bacterium]